MEKLTDVMLDEFAMEYLKVRELIKVMSDEDFADFYMTFNQFVEMKLRERMEGVARHGKN